MPERYQKAQKKLITILGPTSSGKSALAIEMAKRWNGEIISADSRQVYRGMDIGTGKVTQAEQGEAPHHLLDIVDPNDDYNISHFLRDARVAIEDIESRNKLPILCGGTGFWIQTLIENQELPNIPPDPALREELSQKTPEKLFEILAKLDPERTTRIDPKNPRRLIRAIEIARNQNKELGIKNDAPKIPHSTPPVGGSIPHSLLLALCPPKNILDARIKVRLDTRFDEGMIDEVARLHIEGVSWDRLDAFGLEYRLISRYLRNLISEQDMKERLLLDITHYAKRQMTWIRRWHRKNPDICIVEAPEEAMERTEVLLEST